MVAASSVCSQESSLGIVADGCELRNVPVCSCIFSTNVESRPGSGGACEWSGEEADMARIVPF
jgi:hypothetical protein